MTDEIEASYLIAVVTHQRSESLLQLLDSLNQSISSYAHGMPEVLILNNGSELDIDGLRSSYTGKVTLVAMPRNDLCLARNRALTYLLHGDYKGLFFLDDDEYVANDWYAEFRRFVKNAGAHIIAAPVLSVLPNDCQQWEATQIFTRKRFESGSILGDCATGNTYISRELFELVGNNFRFDERFSHLGGEDFDFTSRAIAKGAVIVWCDEAIAYEPIPTNRLSWRWIANRARRTALAEYLSAQPRSIRKLTIFIVGLARVITAIPVLFWPNHYSRIYAVAFRRFHRGLGFMSSVINIKTVRDEY